MQDTRLGYRPINRRLMWWMMGTTSITLVAACAFFVFYDTQTGKRAMVDKAEMLARVVAINSGAALSFHDARAAHETLAGLAAADEVIAAVIYDASGQPFASHQNASGAAGGLAAPPAEAPGHRFQDGDLHLFHAIAFLDEDVGSVYLRLDASELAARLAWFLSVAVLLILTSACVSAIASARLRRQIVEPLEALVESSRAISDGDLSRRVLVSTQDEFGSLAETFNHMTAGLRNLVDQARQSIRELASVSRGLQERGAGLFRESRRQAGATGEVGHSVSRMITSIRDVNTSVEQLAETSHETSTSILEMDVSISEIASNMDQLTSAIDNASAAVTQLTSNIDEIVGDVQRLHAAADLSAGRVRELTSSVAQIAANAGESHALSESSRKEASQGMAAVSDTIEAMGEISSSFGHLRQRVARLADKSESIDEVVQVITGVAEQTGLLSLNAAIIAAQAGEHGTAFSVVADQVSALADRTRRSAHEIADLIDAIKEDTTAAVHAMQEGAAKVERGVERSHAAGEVLGQIIEKTEVSTNRVREIVESTARQSDDLERVDRAAREVQHIVRQINQSAHDQHAATGEIVEAVEHIRKLGGAVRGATEEQRRGSGHLTRAATHVAEMASEIAEATRAQQGSSEIIRHALRVFTEVAEETLRGAEEINASVAALSERATRLENEIDRFKID